ncbi:winged helix-turn-helix transcriptional regulator [Pseudomonas umsongensis]|uniref:winged helix-turn-helix transcriptional regulator n=1 Tax=Pseudomonas umsongensis TaxID=198618 RepID=UPI0015BF16D1|nr:helix-turn-helix domain-containing protein [Pseudomonas umsongensis]NWL22181.1 transcriptional regulator [Pseudomonas umsongensis]
MSNTEQSPTPLSVKARRGDLLDSDCPSREVLKHMTSRWGVLVLVILLGGTHRFSELRRKIGGVSEKMLAQTLQGLDGDGLVSRVSLPVVPPHVEYSLTPLGEQAAQRMESLVDWIEETLPVIMQHRRTHTEP